MKKVFVIDWILIVVFIVSAISGIGLHIAGLEKSEYAVTANDLKNKSDIPILLFLACTGYQ